MKQHEPDIIVAVAEELAQYVDGHNAKAAVCIRLNLQNGNDGFIENRISDILR